MATAPVTCGAAADVPLALNSQSFVLQGLSEIMAVPGAKISTQVPQFDPFPKEFEGQPVSGCLPRPSSGFVAATVIIPSRTKPKRPGE